MTLRNHSIAWFLHCRYRYMLNKQGWETREKDQNQLIGIAAHRALALWRVSKDEVRSMKEAFTTEGLEEESVETVYALLSAYFAKYKDSTLSYIATETEMTVKLPNGVEYGLRVDGIAEYEHKLWVAETKTSGEVAGNFWKRYPFDRQIIGYVWGAGITLSQPIAGVVIDALFKPNSKRPEPVLERKFFEISPAQIADWLEETMAIAGDISFCEESRVFYKSRQCITGWGRACEFIDHCNTGSNLEVLRSTHKLNVDS